MHSWKVWQGLLFLALYTGVGLVLPVAFPYALGGYAKEGSRLKRLCDGLQGFYEKRGPLVYTVEILLLLMMLGVPVKMILRLFFNVKYILEIPAIKMNI